jgi:hypothetical protein
MALFGGRLLPPRAPADGPAAGDGVTTVPGEDLVRGYGVGTITRVRVRTVRRWSASRRPAPACAATTAPTWWASAAGPRPARPLRRLPRTAEEPIQLGDEVDLQVDPGALDQLLEEQRLTAVGFRSEPEALLAEVLLTPRSRLIGRSLAELRFRERYRVNVLSLLRQGQPITGQLADVQLRFADTLLVAGTPQRIELLRGDPGDFVVVAQAAEPHRGAASPAAAGSPSPS